MCTNVGHSHPRVVKAIQEQAATIARRTRLGPIAAEAGVDDRGRVALYLSAGHR